MYEIHEIRKWFVSLFWFQMPEIELNLGNSKVKFEDIVANGLSRFFVIFVCLFFLCLFKKNGLSRFTENSVFSFYVVLCFEFLYKKTDWRVHWTLFTDNFSNCIFYILYFA